MATTEHFRNGGGTTFNFVFPILANSDLNVEIYNDTTKVWDAKTENTSGQTDNDYTISNTNVVFNSATPSGTGNVHIYRKTNVDNPAAVYAAGSSIRAVDLNDNQTQVLYSTQETSNQLVRETDLKDSIVSTDKLVDLNVTTAKIAADAINASKLADNSVYSEHIAAGQVSTSELAADCINASKLADNSVYSEHISASQVSTSELAADCINASKIQDDAVLSEHIAANAVSTSELAADCINASKIQDNAVLSEHIAANAVSTSEILNDSVTIDKIADAAIITAAEQANATSNDTTFLTVAAADARFFNLSTADTIKDGDTFPDNDTTIATTAAINDRIIDLVDDVGGFVPIANETSFPDDNPDINNASNKKGGTLISVKEIAQTRQVTNGTIVMTPATVTSSNNTTVTITGCPAGTLPAGFGMIVETTGTDHTYAFHRLTPKATEVTTVAGSISGVNTVAGISSNVTSVAGISGNVTTVAGISSDVTTVANDGTDIGNVSGSIANVNTTAGSISNVNTVAGSISNVNTVAGNNSNVSTVAGISGNVTTVAGISSNVTTVANDGTDIGLVAGSIGNVNTTAGSIANVNTTAGSIANVNTVGSNITAVTNASTYLNNFLSLYLGEAASDPITDALGNAITEGDLYWNNVTKQLRLYNGSVWQGISDNALELLKIATSSFSAVYTASAGSNNIDLGGLAITGAAFSNESFAPTRMSLAKGSATYNLGGI